LENAINPHQGGHLSTTTGLLTEQARVICTGLRYIRQLADQGCKSKITSEGSTPSIQNQSEKKRESAGPSGRLPPFFVWLQVFAVLKNFGLYSTISPSLFHGLCSETKALTSGESGACFPQPSKWPPICLPLPMPDRGPFLCQEREGCILSAQ